MKALLAVAAFVLLLAGVAFAGVAAPVSRAVPTMTPWGMVGTAVAIGLSGLFFIFRGKK